MNKIKKWLIKTLIFLIISAVMYAVFKLELTLTLAMIDFWIKYHKITAFIVSIICGLLIAAIIPVDEGGK